MNRQWLVTLLLVLFSALFPAVLTGQEQTETESESSDLRSALSPETARQVEVAVDRALEWLSTQQNDDGSFQAANDGQPLTSAFAVMAFLSRGYQPGQGRYGESMTQATEYLLSLQDDDGSFAVRAGNKGRCHAVIGVALSELYGFTTGPLSDRSRRGIERGLAFSRRVQTRPVTASHERGGWTYRPFRYSNLQATVWELMFYRSAANSGFEVPEEWVEEGLAFVERCYIKEPQARIDGVFMNVVGNPKSNFGRTGMGMLSFQYHGRRDDPMVRAGAAWLAGHPVPKQGEIPVFFRQFYTCGRALAQVGAEQWNNFFPRLVDRLLPDQHPDGYWRLQVPPRNSWGEENNGDGYHTGLAVLTLTLPDQLMPIHQR